MLIIWTLESCLFSRWSSGGGSITIFWLIMIVLPYTETKSICEDYWWKLSFIFLHLLVIIINSSELVQESFKPKTWIVFTKYKFSPFLQIEYVSSNYLLKFGREQGLRSLQTYASYEKTKFYVHCSPQYQGWQIYWDTVGRFMEILSLNI